jgi:hypothetical protein
VRHLKASKPKTDLRGLGLQGDDDSSGKKTQHLAKTNSKALQPTRAISSILVGKRHRRDLGDIVQVAPWQAKGERGDQAF